VSETGRTRLGAYGLCVDAERRVLLCRLAGSTPEGNRWTLPGGGMEFGEPPETAALREIEEESGLTGDLAGIAGIYSNTFEQSFAGDPLHVIGIIYRVEHLTGDLRDEVDGSTDACGWFTEAEARALPLVDLAERGLDLAFGPKD
jgi:8-oxo-dGTP diphosphatase